MNVPEELIDAAVVTVIVYAVNTYLPWNKKAEQTDEKAEETK